MARNKNIPRKKGDHSAENMLKGLRLQRNGVSIRKAAKECNIAYPTLRRYVAKNINVSTENLAHTRLVPNYDNMQIFTSDQEQELKEYFKECALKLYGLTTKDCRKVAYQMAVINDISVPGSWNREKVAGKEWLRSFRSRHKDISLKKPEGCSLARATSFNRETVKVFFDNLKCAMDRHPSFGNGCRIYNLDETATTTVQRSQKVIASKGTHNVAKVTSGEKGILVTTCCIVCARGDALPPVLVFPRKNFKDFMMNGAPPGALGLAQPTGWMTGELFVHVMKHFTKHTSATLENPALLILDNHESHLSIEALDLAKRSGVTILTLHPHTTAKMQPLDVGLNAPFKVFYNSAIDSWMMRNPGKSMTIYNVAEGVGIAYAKAMTPVNIAAAFKKCGIFPYDPDVFTEIDYLPSEVTDRPATVDTAMLADVEPQEFTEDRQDAEIPSLASENEETKLPGAASPSLLDTVQLADVGEAAELKYHEPKSTLLVSLSVTQNLASSSSLPPSVMQNPQPSSPVPPSKMQNFISPKQFMPPLKAGPRATNRKIRKKGKSRIATDTPEKTEIEQDRKRLQENKAQKIRRSVFTEIKANIPKKKKPKKEEVETSSDEESEIVPVLSETDISDLNDSDDNDELFVIHGNFEPLPRKPIVGDYILVLFVTKIKVYYIAEVINVISANTYGVSFMRMKNKENMKFFMPLEPDLAEINIKDIQMILPAPKINGSKTRSSTYDFPVRVAPTINLR